jgi:hypothetical protein
MAGPSLLVSGMEQAQAWARAHTVAWGPPNGDPAGRGEGRHSVDAWDLGSTGQRPRERRREELRLGGCRWIPIVGVAVHLGR